VRCDDGVNLNTRRSCGHPRQRRYVERVNAELIVVENAAGARPEPPHAAIEIIEAAVKQSAVVRIRGAYHEPDAGESATKASSGRLESYKS
jgi:hypothetical protein